MPVEILTSIYVYAEKFSKVYIYICRHVHMHICMNMYMCMYIYVCTYIYIHEECTYIYMYIYIYEYIRKYMDKSRYM